MEELTPAIYMKQTNKNLSFMLRARDWYRFHQRQLHTSARTVAVVPVPFMRFIGPSYFFDNWKKMNPIVTVRCVNWNALFKHIIPLDVFSK